MSEFDEGIWQYEKQRASNSRLAGFAAIGLGLLLGGGAVAAVSWMAANGGVEVRVLGPLGGVALMAIVGGITMISSANSRIARLHREREAESFRKPTA